MRLFNRRARLVIGRRDVSGVRIQFRVTKSLQKASNAAELAAWNLASSTRVAAQEQGAPVLLEAGYAEEVALLFAGDVDQVAHERQGPDWVTRVKAGDGLGATRLARINAAFAPGTKAAELLRSIAQRMELSVIDATRQLAEGADLSDAIDTLVGGFTVDGPVHMAFDRAARRLGYEWSVQDGAIQLLRRGQPTRDPAVVLSPSSGLIGSPALGISEGAAGKREVLRARSLLNPHLRPGRIVEVESAAIRGHFRIASVQHVGDTHGNDWYSDLEAYPL